MIHKWFGTLLSEVSNKKRIKAINIGFIETDSNYTLYAIGAKKYDYEDDDWACCEDFVPSNKYLVTDYSVNDMKWDVFACTMKDELLAIINSNDIIVPRTIKYITCGFDDGELEALYKK